MPSTVTTASPRPPFRPVVEHMGTTFTMALIMLVLYLSGFHNPTPRDLELAIVGDSPAAATIEEGISSALGDGVHLREVSTEDEAEALLRNRDIAGAYVPAPDRGTALIASAASATTAETVTSIFQKVASSAAVPLDVVDVVPIASNDPIGQNSFFYMIALSVGSYATAIAIAAAGIHHRFRVRVALAAAASLILATVFFLVAHVFFSLFDASLAATWALSVLYSLAIHFVGVGLHPLLGRFSTLVYATMFVGLNFTSSGGAFNPELQNGFFRAVHEFWIGAGFIEATRTLTYFPELSAAHPLFCLVGWLAFGAACLGLGAWVERQQVRSGHPATLGGEREGLSEDIEEELAENVAPA